LEVTTNIVSENVRNGTIFGSLPLNNWKTDLYNGNSVIKLIMISIYVTVKINVIIVYCIIEYVSGNGSKSCKLKKW